MIASHGYDGKKADVWSVGVILYVLLAGYLPFEETTMVALFEKIKAAHFTYPASFTSSVKDLFSKILVPDPNRRLSLDAIIQHTWMSGPVQGPNEEVIALTGTAKQWSLMECLLNPFSVFSN